MQTSSGAVAQVHESEIWRHCHSFSRDTVGVNIGKRCRRKHLTRRQCAHLHTRTTAAHERSLVMSDVGIGKVVGSVPPRCRSWEAGNVEVPPALDHRWPSHVSLTKVIHHSPHPKPVTAEQERYRLLGFEIVPPRVSVDHLAAKHLR
jgi:hypothetical protein